MRSQCDNSTALGLVAPPETDSGYNARHLSVQKDTSFLLNIEKYSLEIMIYSLLKIIKKLQIVLTSNSIRYDMIIDILLNF